MIFFLLLLGLVLVAQIAELLIPALPWLYNSHVYIVPVIVFYGAMALPFRRFRVRFVAPLQIAGGDFSPSIW